MACKRSFRFIKKLMIVNVFTEMRDIKGKDMNKKYQFQEWLLGFVLMLIDFFIGICTEPLYANVDNFNISLVTNGLFSRDTYTYYLHPWLCKGIKWVSCFYPHADVYTVLMRVFVGISIWVLFAMIIKLNIGIIQKISLTFMVYASSFAISIWCNNYTIQAALFVMCGYTLLREMFNRKKLLYIILASILMCVGFMWRVQGALLTIPFIMLDITIRLIESKELKADLKKIIEVIIIPLICLGIVLCSQSIVENSSKYKMDLEYSKARTVVEDFPVKTWGDVSKEINNISEKEYNAAVSWMLIDTDVVNTNLFKKIAEVGAINKYEYSISGIVNAVKEMVEFIITRRGWTAILGVIIFLTFVLILSAQNNRWKRIEGILSIIGGGIILLYFSIRGRAVDHVWISVIVIVEIILVSIFIDTIVQKQLSRKKLTIITSLIMAICIMGMGWTIKESKIHTPQFAINSRTNNYTNQITVEYKEDDLYIWGKWHKNVTRTYMALGKLPTKEFINHNMALGDWIYGQTYYKDYLKKVNAQNPATALLERKHTYLVEDDCSDVLAFLKEHYGDDIKASKVGNIDKVAVWQFKRK